MLFWTKILLVQRQISPWLAKLDLTVVGTHSSRSASSKMMAGFLPPSSKESFLQWGALSCVIRSAVGWLPVKEMRGTSGWDARASPALGPVPNTIFTTPGGTPALSRSLHIIHAVTDVSSLGLAITVLPAAIAGAIFQVSK